MDFPNVLALPLAEAVSRLETAGVEYDIQLLFPPRDSEENFAGREVRKYVVRQQPLSANKLVLTIAYR